MQQQNWFEVVSRYNFPNQLQSWGQVVVTLVPYIGLWFGMYYSLKVSYWLTLLQAIIAAGFLVRIFIIFHDCGHGSFFRSESLNRFVGIFLGLFVFTPYHRWHRDHKIHHATVGNLDKRGIGDVETLTVEEYIKLSKWKKIQYRVYRHWFFLFVLAPLLLFLIQHRIPKSYMNSKQHLYIQLTNIVLIGAVFLCVFFMGWKEYLLIQLPVIYLASTAGLWLFYVQHQFERVTWKRNNHWDYQAVALQGSSFLKLPRVFQWFTGNIGYHHVHHLSPRIPNYKLQLCHDQNEIFTDISPLTLKEALRSFSLRLWDENSQRLISFSEYKNYYPSAL